MFLFCFSMVKVVWSACQNKSRAEKARITVLEESFLCLLHEGMFFSMSLYVIVKKMREN